MAEKEIYRLEVNVGVTGDDKTKKRLSAMDKYVEKTEKRMKRLDRMEASPAAKLQDKITSPLKKIEGRIGSFAKTAIKKFTAVAAAGALIVGGLGIKDTMSTFMDFEQGLSNVQAVSQATAEELAILRDEAKRLGAETAWSAVQVTEAQTLLAQAGFTVQETIAALPGLLDMASAEGMDLADATDIAAGTLRAFGLAAEEATHVADVLALSATATNSDIAGLGEAMKYVGPAANALGVDLEQTAAAIGMLSNANIKGSQAGTTLRAALTRLAKPSSEAAKLMSALGFEAFDAHGNMLPLDQVIRNLQTSTAALTSEQRANAMATIFGQEAMSGMLALVEQGPDALKELTDSLYNADGAAKQMAETKLDNLAGAITILQSAVEGMKIELGERLAPYARQFVDWLTPKIPIITDKIVELVDRAQEFATRAYPAVKEFISGLKNMLPYIAGIGSAIATIKIGNKIQSGIKAFTQMKDLFSQTVVQAGGVGKALSLLMGPVGVAALVIGGLVTGFILAYKNSEAFRNKVHELKDSFLNFIQPIISTVLPVIQNVGSAFMALVNAVIPFVMAGLELLMGVFKVLWTNVLQPIATYIAGVFSDVIQTAFTVIGSVVTTVVETISGILSGLSSILSGIADFIVGIFTGNWEQAWEGIKGITSGAIEVVKSIFSGLFDFLKDIPGHMLEIGKNIMKGLANGIKTAISIPVNAIKNVGKSIVDGVKGALKIKSPSRVMIEYGEFTTEGLAKGIEDRIPKLEAVVGTTYEVITKEEAKENKITRTPILQQAYEKIKSFRPFYPVFEPDDPEGGNKPTARVALAGAGGGTTYNIYIDDIDVNVSGTGDGSNEDIYEIVEQAQEEFGRKLLEALKDKK